MRPYTIIFSTMTVDGRIASTTGYSRLSCQEDFMQQHRLRAWADLVIVGSNTAAKDNPRLTVRLVPGRTPWRGLVDSKLRVPPTARIYQHHKTVLITTEGHGDKLKPYKEKGALIIEAGKEHVDLPRAWRQLWNHGFKRIMVEGGGTLNYMLLKHGLVDKLIVTIAPYAFGAGTSILQDPQGTGLPDEKTMAKLAVEKIQPLCGGHWITITYKVLNS